MCRVVFIFFQDVEPRASRTATLVKESERLRSKSRVGRKRERSVSRGEAIATATSTLVKRAKTMAGARSASKRDRSEMGLKAGQKDVAIGIKKLGERARNMLAKAGESDRSVQTKMPKHLFSGKRGFQASHR